MNEEEMKKDLKEIFKKLEDLCEGSKIYADEILSELYSLKEFYSGEEEDEDG